MKKIGAPIENSCNLTDLKFLFLFDGKLEKEKFLIFQNSKKLKKMIIIERKKMEEKTNSIPKHHIVQIKRKRDEEPLEFLFFKKQFKKRDEGEEESIEPLFKNMNLKEKREEMGEVKEDEKEKELLERKDKEQKKGLDRKNIRVFRRIKLRGEENLETVFDHIKNNRNKKMAGDKIIITTENEKDRDLQMISHSRKQKEKDLLLERIKQGRIKRVNNFRENTPQGIELFEMELPEKIGNCSNLSLNDNQLYPIELSINQSNNNDFVTDYYIVENNDDENLSLHFNQMINHNDYPIIPFDELYEEENFIGPNSEEEDPYKYENNSDSQEIDYPDTPSSNDEDDERDSQESYEERYSDDY